MGKWFPRLYDTLMEPLERRGLRDIRKNLIRKASGKVLEIGSGTGFNFPYYEQAEKVVAIEPEPLMREQSLEKAKTVRIPIEVILAGAEALPFPDNTFDTVVGTLVLCTIPNPSKALAEIRRVCKSDGTVLFFEHVRLSDPFLGRLQDWLTPIWKQLCDGCHLNRDSLEQVKRAGFKVIRIEQYFKNIFIVIEAANKKI
nr:class I SAM-dependent methyltransferase [Aneurinibacillus terranovensis]